MKKRRIVIRVCLAILLVAGVITVADTVLAIRVERHLASSVQSHAALEMEPRVYVGATPYSLGLMRLRIPQVDLNFQDIDHPHLGLVNSRIELHGLTGTREQLLNGDYEGTHCELIRNLLSMDDVTVGRHLNVANLNMSDPYETPRGDTQGPEIALTGTPPGFSEPVSILASLRLRGDTFSMTPRDVITAPKNREQEALDAFHWSFSTHSLGLSGTVKAVYVKTDSIFFESERANTTVTDTDLLPFHHDDPEE